MDSKELLEAQYQNRQDRPAPIDAEQVSWNEYADSGASVRLAFAR